jgi:hypothetical protein
VGVFQPCPDAELRDVHVSMNSAIVVSVDGSDASREAFRSAATESLLTGRAIRPAHLAADCQGALRLASL